MKFSFRIFKNSAITARPSVVDAMGHRLHYARPMGGKDLTMLHRQTADQIVRI